MFCLCCVVETIKSLVDVTLQWCSRVAFPMKSAPCVHVCVTRLCFCVAGSHSSCNICRKSKEPSNVASDRFLPCVCVSASAVPTGQPSTFIYHFDSKRKTMVHPVNIRRKYCGSASIFSPPLLLLCLCLNPHYESSYLSTQFIEFAFLIIFVLLS
jgi:hypothetical protein